MLYQVVALRINDKTQVTKSKFKIPKCKEMNKN